MIICNNCRDFTKTFAKLQDLPRNILVNILSDRKLILAISVISFIFRQRHKMPANPNFCFLLSHIAANYFYFVKQRKALEDSTWVEQTLSALCIFIEQEEFPTLKNAMQNNR